MYNRQLGGTLGFFSSRDSREGKGELPRQTRAFLRHCSEDGSLFSFCFCFLFLSLFFFHSGSPSEWLSTRLVPSRPVPSRLVSFHAVSLVYFRPRLFSRLPVELTKRVRSVHRVVFFIAFSGCEDVCSCVRVCLFHIRIYVRLVLQSLYRFSAGGLFVFRSRTNRTWTVWLSRRLAAMHASRYFRVNEKKRDGEKEREREM